MALTKYLLTKFVRSRPLDINKVDSINTDCKSLYHSRYRPIARVVPIFKSGDKALLNNYRPISVLPCISKILERTIYNRIINYLNDFNVLCDNQYSFRKNRSPSLALIDLCDRISSAFDRREYALGVFLDLSKASDTVNHAILFDKLEHSGLHVWSSTRMGKKLFL